MGLALRWLAVVVLVAATVLGVLVNVVNYALLAYVIVAGVRRLVAVARRRLHVAWLRRPFARAHRGQLVRAVAGLVFIALIGVVERASIVPEQLGDEYGATCVVVIATLILAAVLQVLPLAASRRAAVIPLVVANGFLVVVLVMILQPTAAAVTLASPMSDELLVMHGGSSPVVNHHYVMRAQRHALDLVVVEDDRIYADDRSGNERSRCFGRDVRAPAAGVVVRALDGLRDNPPGEMDRDHLTGNHVVIQIAPERYVLLAHLRSGSIRVKPGDALRVGQPVGACGNSGNSSEPHLHLQVQDRPDYDADATTFPIAFAGRVLRRNDRVPAPRP